MNGALVEGCWPHARGRFYALFEMTELPGAAEATERIKAFHAIEYFVFFIASSRASSGAREMNFPRFLGPTNS